MLWCRWRRSQVHTYWVKKSTLIAIWVEIRPIGHPRLSLIKVLFLTNVSTLFKSEQKKRVVRIFPDIIINGNNKQLQWLNRLLFSTAVLHCKNVITISHVIMSVGRSREKAKSWLELEMFFGDCLSESSLSSRLSNNCSFLAFEMWSPLIFSGLQQF